MKVIQNLSAMGLLIAATTVNLVALATTGGSVSEQPLQIHCKVATRVVAGQIHLGMDPMTGYFTYTVDKYHATNPSQTYTKSGSNIAFNSRTLNFKTSNDSIRIQLVSQVTVTRAPVRNQNILVQLTQIDQEQGEYALHSFIVDGQEHIFEYGPVSCSNIESPF